MFSQWCCLWFSAFVSLVNVAQAKTVSESVNNEGKLKKLNLPLVAYPCIWVRSFILERSILLYDAPWLAQSPVVEMAEWFAFGFPVSTVG